LAANCNQIHGDANEAEESHSHGRRFGRKFQADGAPSAFYTEVELRRCWPTWGDPSTASGQECRLGYEGGLFHFKAACANADKRNAQTYVTGTTLHQKRMRVFVVALETGDLSGTLIDFSVEPLKKTSNEFNSGIYFCSGYFQ
jgi:hypothetical protein